MSYQTFPSIFVLVPKFPGLCLFKVQKDLSFDGILEVQSHLVAQTVGALYDRASVLQEIQQLVANLIVAEHDVHQGTVAFGKVGSDGGQGTSRINLQGAVNAHIIVFNVVNEKIRELHRSDVNPIKVLVHKSRNNTLMKVKWKSRHPNNICTC